MFYYTGTLNESTYARKITLNINKPNTSKTIWTWVMLIGVITLNRSFANPQTCLEAAEQSNKQTFEICQTLLEKEPALSPDEVSIVMITQADYLMRRSEFSQANKILDAAFKSNPKMLENSIFRHNWLRSKGALYSMKNDYAAALPFYQQALEISQILGRDGLISSNLNNLGGIYSELGSYSTALKHFDEATDIYLQSKDFFKQGLTLANMAEIYEKQGDINQAKIYFESALKLQVKNLDSPEQTNKKSFFAPYIAHLYEDLGRIAVLQDQPGEAERYLQLALQTYQKEGLTREQIRVYSALSELQLKQGHIKTATTTIHSGLELEQSTENLNSFSLRNSLIKVFIKSSQWTEAEQLATESLLLSEQLKDSEQQQVFLNYLSDISEKQNDLSQALAYKKRFYQLKEQELKSLFDQSTGKLQSAIDLEKKKNDIALLEIEKKDRELEFNQQRFWLMLLVMALLLAGILLLLLLRKRSIQHRLLTAEMALHQQQLKQMSVDVSRVSQVLSSADVPLIFLDDTGHVLYTNRLEGMGMSDSIKHISEVLPSVWLSISETTDSEDGLTKDLFFKKTDIIEKIADSIEGIWIHPMSFMDDSLVMVLIGNTYTEKALQATDQIKKYTQYNNLLQSANHQAKEIKISQSDLLNPVSKALQKLQDDINPSNHHKDELRAVNKNLKIELVSLMVTLVDLWCAATHSSQIELAEQSGLWVVNIDDGRLRTRTMDKYMSLQRIPQTPRWRQVVKTAHFVLSNCSLDFSQRKSLNEKLDRVLNTINSQATSVISS